jgi:transketolase
MAAVSRADIRLVGSHCGVSIGQDGPSQMGLEDIAALRSVHDSTVLYPSCANQTAKLVAATSRPRIVMLAVRVMPPPGPRTSFSPRRVSTATRSPKPHERS